MAEKVSIVIGGSTGMGLATAKNLASEGRTVVIVGRELAVTGLRGIASAGGEIVAAGGAGKIKTVAQNVAVGSLLFPQGTLGLPNHELGVALLVVATALTFWSGYVYFAEYFRGEAARHR